MLFNSLEFLFFVITVFLLYYLPVLRKSQKHILILASFFFYSFHTPWLLLLFVFSISINASSSYWAFHFKSKSKKYWIAIIGVISNLSILFMFKYGGFIELQIRQIISSGSVGDILLALPLPIGISFYTFQGISLVVDVKNDKNNLVDQSFWEHFRNTAHYLSFFPQLVAGPILKPVQFLPQIKIKSFKYIQWRFVFRYLILGYFFKMVIADNISPITGAIIAEVIPTLSAYTLLIYLYGYSIQIFADFAGYSFIALGLGYLFGYRLIINFNYPYISKSFAEFWRRWHISLSHFLKMYLYIPLGGNKKSSLRTYLNLFVVMFLGGLWHGAEWSYAIWGVSHGMLLSIERALVRKIKLKQNRIIKFFQIIFVFTCVTLVWLLFKLPNINDVILYFKCIYQNINMSPTGFYREDYIIILSLPIVLYHLLGLMSISKKKKYVVPYQSIIYAGMLFFIIFSYGPKSDFVYFQF